MCCAGVGTRDHVDAIESVLLDTTAQTAGAAGELGPNAAKGACLIIRIAER